MASTLSTALPKRPGDEWFHAIVSSALDCIIAIDRHGKLIEFNEAAETTFGYRREDVIGRSMAELIIPERFRFAHHQGLRRFLETGVQKVSGRRIEVIAKRADGSEFPVELTIIPLRPADATFFTAYLRDISDRKSREMERLRHEAELRRLLEQTVLSVSRILETRDPYTAGHQRRVATLAKAIGADLGLDSHRCDGLYLGCLIHDIGKVAVPAEILTRPGRLDGVSMALVRTHCDVGFQITKDIHFPWPIADIVHQHHERMNGSGYPGGLKGEGILLEARIAAVADVYEAIMSHRPYRAALGEERALAEIADNATTLYDPDVVASCVKLVRAKNFEFGVDEGFKPPA
ncbi:MAG: PAS domain S-box protein [Alphaproteobacteria bacterium]|nr:PAS domain S-box protein [Alphaproteobacteria bacterium]